MRLTSFHVQRFRNVLDSTVVEVEADITCMVGKNESGKTAMLQALYRLQPVYGEKFDSAQQYPRWRQVHDRRMGNIDDARPITATFELDTSDRSAVDEVVGKGALTGNKLTIYRAYVGGPSLEFDFEEAKAVAHMAEQLDLPSGGLKLLKRPATLTALKAGLAKGIAAGQKLAETEPESGSSAAAAWQVAEASLTAIVGKYTSLRHLASNLLWKRTPEFFYFGEYQYLPGDIDLRKLAGEEEEPGASGLQTARALLALAETDVDALQEEDWTARTAELEAVSNDLTRQVAEYWTQNQELQINIAIDKVTETTPQGQTAVARFLKIGVRDARHGFTNSFDDRSTGFRWFFSFLAAFSEFETRASDDERPLIVLLDEPALTLHGRAQRDFLRFIQERLAPNAQVIYTTHSPFMVEARKLERVRIVEDRGPDTGATVTREVLSVNEDSLFPLQGALGYDIAQHLFIGDANILVEGTSDYTYLTVISDYLKSLGRRHLDDRWRILPVGGATNVPAFVALMGRNLDVTVLVDESRHGMQRLRNLVDSGLLTRQRLVAVSEVTGGGRADIEDVFDVADFLNLYNNAFAVSLTVKGLQPGDRIIDRISRTEGTNFTDHGRPVDFLLRNRDTVLPTLSTATLDRFVALFDRINATLPT